MDCNKESILSNIRPSKLEKVSDKGTGGGIECGVGADFGNCIRVI